MHLEVLTPKKKEFAGEIEKMVLPTLLGEITVLPGHAPLISVLKAGKIKIKTKEKEIPQNIEGGILEVSKNKATLLLKQFYL